MTSPAGPVGRLVAITGAAGGLGLALTAELVARGERVRALVRSEQAAAAVAALGAEPCLGDLRDEAALERLLTGAVVVYHLAAWMGAPAGQAEAVNVRGSERLARLALAAGARRLVLASSVAVYGPVTSGRVSEATPTRKVGDPYGDSKIEAERAVREVLGGSGTELVVLRPTMLYGPASNSWTMTPFAAIRRGLPLVVGDGSGLLDALYLSDAARYFAAAGSVAAAAGRTLNLTGESVSFRRFFGAYAAMAGVRLRHLPRGLVVGGARLAAAVTRLLPGPAKVVPEMLGVMTSQASFDGEEAKRVLGVSPEVGLEEGMWLTADWLRQTGHLAGPRSVLVVGAAAGLGRAVVERLKRAYVTVHAADLNGAATAALAAPGVSGHAVDLRSQAKVAEVVEEIERASGPIEAVVVTAGSMRPGALEVQAEAEIGAQLDLNALGPLRVARAVSPAMRQRGRGRIVFVGSTNGVLVTPFMGAYSAGKFALEAIADSLRLELRPFGVEVVLVQPGAMSTGFAQNAKSLLSAEASRVGEPWQGYLERLLAADLWGERMATGPDAVALVVMAALFGRHPRPRLNGTRDVIWVKLFAALPDRLKDYYFARQLGLRRPRR